MDRYFIVTYMATSPNKSTITGQINMTCGKLQFLNREATTDVIWEANDKMIWDIVITFILEVSAADWKVWTYKKEIES